MKQQGHRNGILRLFYRLVAEHGKRVGVGEINPRLLRHKFCTLLSELDVPVEEIKELAGHVDSRTTFVYTHVKEGRTVSAMSELGWSGGGFARNTGQREHRGTTCLIEVQGV